jgi:hypothetical protein
VSSLRRALDGELVGWGGLPSGFDERALRREVAADWTFEPRAGVRTGHSFGIMRAPGVGMAADLEAWIPTGGAVISSLEYRPHPNIDHAAILADLGEPELVLRSRQFQLGALVRDRVHAARGITLAVAEPFPDEHGQTEARRIVYVQLYEATSTTTFVTSIGQSGIEIHPYPVPDTPG